MTTTPVVVVAQKKEMIAPLFPAEVYGGRVARALDALAALDACVSADLLRGPVAPETAPFVRPHEGTLYGADTLTWRFYHTNAGCVVHAINNQTYGAALYAGFLFDLENNGDEDTHIFMRADLPSLDRVRAALLSVRRTLRRSLRDASPSSGHYYYD
jgi:hypothetical protein